MNTKFGTSLILILILTFHFDFDLTLTFSDNIHDVHMMCVCAVNCSVSCTRCIMNLKH